MFGRYDPHYIILPDEIRHKELSYVDIWTSVMRYDINRLKRLSGDLPLNKVTDANRNTLIHLCAMYGNVKAMDYILKQRPDRPDINAKNIFGTTALHMALERAQGNQYTNDFKDILWMLLDFGADPRAFNGLGNSTLVTASGCTCPVTIFKIYEKISALVDNKFELVKLFVHAGWSLSHFFWTKDFDLIKQMLRYDTEALNVGEAPENTPLHEAIEARTTPEVFGLLLEYGVDPNVATAGEMNTPLHRLCELSKKWDNLDIVKMLLAAGADPNAVNSKQCTCLHVALSFGTAELVKLLLKKDANVHAKDETGNTAMHCAAFNGNVEIIKILVSMGFGIDEKNAHGVTPLHMSSRRSRLEATEYLLQQGADVNWKDHRGWAALHYAVQSCSCEGPMHECIGTIEVLVNKGAELDMQEPGEKSALRFCIDNHNFTYGFFLIRSLAIEDPRNPEARALTIEMLEKNRMLKEYYDRCIREIKKMKKKTLYGRVSYYKALTCSNKEMRAFVRNPEYVKAMNKFLHCDYVCRNFLIYRYRLITKFITVMNEQAPINDATEALCYLSGYGDPTNEVITTIISFLEPDDIKTLAKCKLIIEQES